MSKAVNAVIMLILAKRAGMAVDKAVEALKRDPNDGRLHALLAIALSEEGKHDVALKAAQRAVALEPELSIAHEPLAIVQINRNEMEQAREALREAIRLDPQKAMNHAYMAFTYQTRGKLEKGLEHALVAVRLDPTLSWPHELCAESLRLLNRVDEALEHGLAALKNDPESASAHAVYGATLLSAGRPQEALASMFNAKRINPNNTVIHEGLLAALNEQVGWYRFFAARQMRALERDEISPLGRILPVLGGLAFLVGLSIHIVDEYKRLVGPFIMIGGVVATLGAGGLMLFLDSAATLSLQFNKRTRWMLRPVDRFYGNVGTAFVLLSVGLIIAAFFVPGWLMVPGAVITLGLIGPACAVVSLRDGAGRRKMKIATVVDAIVFSVVALAVSPFGLLIKAVVFVGIIIAGAWGPMSLPDDEWN